MSGIFDNDGRLEQPAKSIGQLRLEAAAAIRALNDEGFMALLNEMQKAAGDAALLGTDSADRETARIKFLTIVELRGRLMLAADYQAEQREDAARAQTYE
jgi:hypothetical protein